MPNRDPQRDLYFHFVEINDFPVSNRISAIIEEFRITRTVTKDGKVSPLTYSVWRSQ
ncbi:MAG: hypothetical protein H6Q42_2611 [Deltaproteobacteria bacterium]|nr:hypothetical protein [Deltaproteobacteria bacterium]